MKDKYNVFDSEYVIATKIVNNICDDIKSNVEISNMISSLADFIKKYKEHCYEDGYMTGLDECEDWIG